jgi:hypothetical protein
MIVQEQSPEDEWFLMGWRAKSDIEREEYVLAAVKEMDLRGYLIESKREQVADLELQVHRLQEALKSVECLA